MVHLAGDKPQRYIFLPARPVVNSRFGKPGLGKVALEIDWSVYPGSESGTCFRTNHGVRNREIGV